MIRLYFYLAYYCAKCLFGCNPINDPVDIMISDFYQCIDKRNLGKLEDISTLHLFCLENFETIVDEIKQCTLYRMLLRC